MGAVKNTAALIVWLESDTDTDITQLKVQLFFCQQKKKKKKKS